MSAVRMKARWFVIPLVLYLAIFSLVPEILAIVESLRSAFLSNFSVQPWSGLTNYTLVWTTPQFWQSVLFSLKFAVITTLAELIIGFALSLLFEKVFAGHRVLVSLLLLPIMLSPALMGIMYELMLNEYVGPITYYLGLIGINMPNIMSGQGIVPVVMIIDILEWSPFVFLLLYTSLTSIPSELMESAGMDGATGMRRIGYILAPLMRSTMVVAFFMQFMAEFRRFSMLYLFTGGGPGSLTTSVSIFIYKLGYHIGNLGEASAASVILVALMIVPLIFAVRYMVADVSF